MLLLHKHMSCCSKGQQSPGTPLSLVAEDRPSGPVTRLWRGFTWWCLSTFWLQSTFKTYLWDGIRLIQRCLAVLARYPAQTCLPAVNKEGETFRGQLISSVLNVISRKRVISQRTVSFLADHRRSLRGHPSTFCVFRSTKKPASNHGKVCC